jgi:glycosyltransferase involved in cell wall biosynthesis
MLTSAIISTCSSNPQSWRWYEPETRSSVRWLFHTETPSSPLERLVKRPNLARIRCTFDCVDQAIRERADMVIAHSDRTTFWTSVAMNLRRTDMPLLSYSFNLPSLPTGTRLYGLKQAVKRVQRFVVHSELERQTYAAYLDIPLDRIDVVRWGVEIPTVQHDSEPHIPGSYICAIGKDRRDYPTLVRAMEQLPDLKLVIVALPQNFPPDLKLPSNVEVLYNIPLDLAMNVLQHSQFMALPLQGEKIACGHITIVWAMLYHKAFVATRSAGLSDYIPDHYAAPQVGAGDVEGWVKALRLMVEDTPRRERCEEVGDRFARTYCSHAAALQGCCDVLQKEGIKIELN